MFASYRKAVKCRMKTAQRLGSYISTEELVLALGTRPS
jgi:hypothetical protein